MRKILIKLAYMILKYYSLGGLPYYYCNKGKYKIISEEIHPIEGYVIIKAERV